MKFLTAAITSFLFLASSSMHSLSLKKNPQQNNWVNINPAVILSELWLFGNIYHQTINSNSRFKKITVLNEKKYVAWQYTVYDALRDII